MLSIDVIDQLMNTLHIKTNILVIVSLTLLFLGCSSQSQIQYPDATFSQENIEIPKEQIEDVESKKIESLTTQDFEVKTFSDQKPTSQQELPHSEDSESNVNKNQLNPKNETINSQSFVEHKLTLEGNISRDELRWAWSFSATAGDRIRISRIVPDDSLIDFNHVEVSLYLGGLEQILGKDDDLKDVLIPKTAIYNLVVQVGDYKRTSGDFVIELRSSNIIEVQLNPNLFEVDPLDSLAERVDSRLGGCVISNGINEIPTDLRAIGPITRTNDFRPFTKKMVVFGITLISGDDVSDEFMLEIAEIIEEIFSEHTETNSELQNKLLGNLYKYKATIPIFNGEPDFLKSSHWLEYEFLKKNNSICDVIMKHQLADKDQANEIIEHLLHIISDVGLLYTFPDIWGIAEDSLIHSVMVESIEEGVFNVEDYFLDGFSGEEEIMRRILIQEFAYWGIVTFWNLLSEIAPDDYDSEWEIENTEELRLRIPRFEVLLKQTVAEVMTVPTESLVRFLEVDSLEAEKLNVKQNPIAQNQLNPKNETINSQSFVEHKLNLEGNISQERKNWVWSFSATAGDRIRISRIVPDDSLIDFNHVEVSLHLGGLEQIIGKDDDLKDVLIPKTAIYNLLLQVGDYKITSGDFVIEIKSSNVIEIELIQENVQNDFENDSILITHINGDLIPKLTSAGTDECDDRIEKSLFCVEILSYEGVSQIAIDRTIQGVSALADQYAVKEEELHKTWTGFGSDGGIQNYVGVVLWHSEKSDREKIKQDACQFRVVASAPNVPADNDQCMKSIDDALDFSEKAAMQVSGTKRNNGYIIYLSEYAWKWYPTGRLHNKLNDPKKIAAHEFMHSYQGTHTNNMSYKSNNLIPNEGPIWFVEGSAEYAAIRSTSIKGWVNWEQMMNFHYALINSTVLKFPEISISMNETRAHRDIINTKEYGHVLTYEMGLWAVAFAISISSHDAVMVDYWDDLEEVGPRGSFEKNVGVDLETFYMLFDDFMELDKDAQISEISNQIN